MVVTKDHLKALSRITDENKLVDLALSFNKYFTKYGLLSPLEICHFLAQVLHESGGLTLKLENLNYSADGLLRTFPKYFNTANVQSYARNQEKIANKVYANRMGNGDEASGDGWKFRGRGYIQLTGRNNYTALKEASKIDFITNPSFLELPDNCVMSACWFWKTNNIGLIVAKLDVTEEERLQSITKRVNGGQIGINDRREYLHKCKSVLIGV